MTLDHFTQVAKRLQLISQTEWLDAEEKYLVFSVEDSKWLSNDRVSSFYVTGEWIREARYNGLNIHVVDKFV